jgi:hypothetical protein
VLVGRGVVAMVCVALGTCVLSGESLVYVPDVPCPRPTKRTRTMARKMVENVPVATFAFVLHAPNAFFAGSSAIAGSRNVGGMVSLFHCSSPLKFSRLSPLRTCIQRWYGSLDCCPASCRCSAETGGGCSTNASFK